VTDHDMAEVYRKFGETAEAGQLLETELGNILFSAKAADNDLFKGDRPELAAAMLQRINKSTLGRVLRQVSTSRGLPEHLDQVFAEALAERNRLVHSFYREHNFRRNSAAGREIMLSDLAAIHVTISRAYNEALRLSGVDLDAIMRNPPSDLPTKHVRI
jgi:hypothetical protein